MINKKYEKIIFLSFPRSGHHLLTDMITEIYNKETDTKDNYCEFYKCCNVFPCRYGKVFCKNHDFLIKIQVKPEYFYIVQYRIDAYEQMLSYYNFKIKYEDYKKSMKEFVETIRGYYRSWIKKWIDDSTEHSNIHFIDYDSLIENPKKHITDICNIIFTKKIDDTFIEFVIEKKNIHSKNKWNYMTEGEFKKLLDIKINKKKCNCIYCKKESNEEKI